MINALRAELRKLLTVRSTYLLTVLSLVLVGAFVGYVFGFRAGPEHNDPQFIMNGLITIVTMLAVFGAIIGTLLMAHEYRYNTIMYSLTAANSRSKVLLAKVLVLTLYAVAYTVLASFVTIVAAYAGIALANGDIGAQQIFVAGLAWRLPFYMWAYTMVGLLFALLFRNLVATIVAVFLLPGTVEGLLSLVLKDNTKYLPFTALNQVAHPDMLSAAQGAGIFMAYLLVTGALAWLLFLRRDAN